MLRKIAIALAAGALASTGAAAQDTAKIGLVLPLTGGLAPVGKQVQAGAKLYMDKHGTTVAGKKIDLIIKDDAGVPDNSKRLAQEFIVNEKVAVVGSALTPSAMAIGPFVDPGQDRQRRDGVGHVGRDQSQQPLHGAHQFHLGAAVRHHRGMGGEERQQESRDRAVRLGAGRRSHRRVHRRLHQGRRQVVETIKVPLANPDFAPFLQRARDLNPDTLFVFVPAGQAGTFAKQFTERGLDKAGIKLIGPGDIVDDNDLAGMGDAMLGVVTAGIYSAAHNSPANKEYVAAFKKANNYRPNFISLGGYDGMHLIYEALKKTGGKTDGDALVDAMKGMKWESPRGPISIDPDTRDIVQNIYIGKVEKVGGELYNVEFATFDAVKDPLKMKK